MAYRALQYPRATLRGQITLFRLGGLQSKERAGCTGRKVSTRYSCFGPCWAKGLHGLSLQEASCAGEGPQGALESHLNSAFRATLQDGDQGQDGVWPIKADVVKGVQVYNRGAQPTTLKVCLWLGRFHMAVLAASLERH